MSSNNMQGELDIYLDLIRYGPKSLNELKILYNKPDNELISSLAKLEDSGLVKKVESLYIPIPQLKIFLEALNKDIITLKRGFDNLITNVRSLESKLNSLSSEIKVTIQNTMQNYYGSLISEMDKIDAELSSELNNVLDSITKVLINNVNSLKIINNNLISHSESIEAIISNLDLAKERALTKAISDIKERLSSSIAELLSFFKKSLIEIGEEILAIRDIVATEIDKIFNTYQAQHQKLSESLSNISVGLIELINDQKTEIDESVTLIDQELRQQIDELAEKVHLLNKEISKFLSAFLSDLKEGMERFTTNARRRISTLEDSIRSMIDTAIDNYAQKIIVQINSIKDQLIRKMSEIQIDFNTEKKSIDENISKASLEIRDKISANISRIMESITNYSNKINELVSSKLMKINSIFSDIFEQSVNTLLDITKSYEEIILQELESLYREILSERKDILDKINQNLLNLSDKISSIQDMLEKYEIGIEKEAVNKLNAHLDEVMNRIEELVNDYSSKMNTEINTLSRKIVNEIGRIIAKTLLKSKKERESLARDIKEINRELDSLDNIIKELESASSKKNQEIIAEITNKINALKKKTKKISLSIERSGRVGEDELVKIKENVVILMDDITKRYTNEILSSFLDSIKTELKEYIPARVEELIQLYSEKLKEFREKFRAEINWITASLSSLSSELKSDIERGDQAIFGIFDAISRRSIGIGKKVIDERESEVELLQNNIRKEVSLLSKEISELLQQNNSAITDEFKIISQNIASLIDEISKGIGSALDKFVETSISKLNSVQQEMLANLNQISISFNTTLDEFRKNVDSEVHQVIEKTSMLLNKYYKTFESKTIKSLETAKSSMNGVIEDMITTIDSDISVINSKLMERLNKLSSDLSNYTQVISRDLGSLQAMIEKQVEEARDLLMNTKNNVLDKVSVVSSSISNKSLELDDFYKNESNWFSQDYIELVKSNVSIIYQDIKEKFDLTHKELEKIIIRVNELIEEAKKSKDLSTNNLKEIKDMFNKFLRDTKKNVEVSFSKLKEEILRDISDRFEKLDELKSIRQLIEKGEITDAVGRIESDYEKAISMDELLSKHLSNYIEKALVTIGKESIDVYLKEAVKSAQSLVVIVAPERLDFLENVELDNLHNVHIELIAPQRVISEIEKLVGDKIFLTKANKSFNFLIVIRDDEEALLSIKRLDTWISYLFREKNIIDNLKEVIRQIL